MSQHHPKFQVNITHNHHDTTQRTSLIHTLMGTTSLLPASITRSRRSLQIYRFPTTHICRIITPMHHHSPFQLESRVEHHMIQPNQPLTPHPLNNEKKRMETGTNGETPATSEFDLSFILQGILGLSLSWMISTFSHVLSLLLLWVSEDVVLDELMKRLFCFASRWRCEWMCLRLNE